MGDGSTSWRRSRALTKKWETSPQKKGTVVQAGGVLEPSKKGGKRMEASDKASTYSVGMSRVWVSAVLITNTMGIVATCVFSDFHQFTIFSSRIPNPKTPRSQDPNHGIPPKCRNTHVVERDSPSRFEVHVDGERATAAI